MVRRSFSFTTLTMLASLLVPQFARGYTPKSPEVVTAVERAAKYLETVANSNGADDGMGESALIALALLKADRELSHPRIQSTLKRCVAYADKMNPTGVDTMYATAIVTVLMLEADAQRYKPQIQKLLDVILRRQLRFGGWGYKGSPKEGDTSQSQYCVLALWEAYNHGFDIKLQRVAAICHWLIRTQDPSGGFSYMGRDSNAVGKRINQPEVSHSMTVAGAGSLYICMDLLGFQEEASVNDADSEFPPDVRLVSEDVTDDPRGKRDGAALGIVNVPELRNSVNLGNNWFRRNYKVEYGGVWQYYYMYGMERYQTFRDKVENRTDPEPGWYNDGVSYLLKKQERSGRWPDSVGHVGPVSTCFAVFFLTRSTQKTIGAILMNQGVLKGGQGFQKGELRSTNGRIVGVPLSRSVSDLLTSLKEGNEDELVEMAKSVAKLKFEGSAADRAKHQAMLRGLVSHRLYAARLAAVKTLAQQRDFDNIPALIYALSDPDWRVALAARNGLRFISRKINGFGLPKQPKEQEVAVATKKWKNWYLSIRPDGKLFN